MEAEWRAWKWMVLIAFKNAVTDLTAREAELAATCIVNDGISSMTHV